MHKAIYKDNNNTWYIHTTIKGKSVTIRGFVSKQDANENYEIAIEKWKREHNLSTSGNQYDIVLNEFYKYRSVRVANETLKKDKMYFNSYWNKIFANQTLSSVFNIDRLKIIYDNLCADKNVAETKRYRLITAFSEFTSYCYMMRYIQEDIHNTIKMMFVAPRTNKRTETNKRYIPETQINAILSDIIKDNDNLFYLAVSVLYSCGLRISELLGLLGSDVDLQHKKIKVQRQLQSNGQLTEQLKTSNSYREVPFKLKIMQKNCTKDNERAFPYSHTEFRRKLARYTDYTAHEFRHTFCTNLAKKCSNVADVTYCAKVSGHSVSMFLNTYCKSLDNELENKFF